MIEMFVPKTANGRRPQIKMDAEWITVHSTGNLKSTARNEANNIVNNDPGRQVSFHAVVDDKESYNTIPLNEVAWHAGDGRGAGNMKSIGVEICESGDRRQTLLNAIEVIKGLMRSQNIKINHIVQHNHWSGKNCPRILRNPAYIQGGMDWNWFISKLRGENMTKAEAKQIVKDKLSLSDATIQYIADDYRYGDELIIKIAEGLK